MIIKTDPITDEIIYPSSDNRKCLPFDDYIALSASREREYQQRVATEKALEAAEKEKQELLLEKAKLMELLKNAGIKID